MRCQIQLRTTVLGMPISPTIALCHCSGRSFISHQPTQIRLISLLDTLSHSFIGWPADSFSPSACYNVAQPLKPRAPLPLLLALRSRSLGGVSSPRSRLGPRAVRLCDPRHNAVLVFMLTQRGHRVIYQALEGIFAKAAMVLNVCFGGAVWTRAKTYV